MIAALLLAAAAASQGRLVVLVVVDQLRYQDVLWLAPALGPRGFAGELLEDAGGENAAGANDLPFPRMSAEAAVRAAPDVIILCGIDAPPGRAPIPGLEKVPVRSLRSTALLHPGPRVPEALSDLALALAR